MHSSGLHFVGRSVRLLALLRAVANIFCYAVLKSCVRAKTILIHVHGNSSASAMQLLRSLSRLLRIIHPGCRTWNVPTAASNGPRNDITFVVVNAVVVTGFWLWLVDCCRCRSRGGGGPVFRRMPSHGDDMHVRLVQVVKLWLNYRVKHNNDNGRAALQVSVGMHIRPVRL